MKLELIHPQIASAQDFARLSARHDPASPAAAFGYRAGQWFEIEAAQYWQAFAADPPLAHTGGSFALAEFPALGLTDSFHAIEGRFFCMTIAYRGRASVNEARAALAAATAGKARKNGS